jgi:hypothetical protein
LPRPLAIEYPGYPRPSLPLPALPAAPAPLAIGDKEPEILENLDEYGKAVDEMKSMMDTMSVDVKVQVNVRHAKQDVVHARTDLGKFMPPRGVEVV